MSGDEVMHAGRGQASRSPAGPPRIIAIVGPTASGKSALAVSLALRFGGEIVSCDSAAVYRRLDVGTGKVAPQDRRGVAHHVVDVVEPTADFTAAEYLARAVPAVRSIAARGRVPIVAGGTGLYYRALTRGLFAGPGRDAALRARLERIAARRPPGALHRMLGRVDPDGAARIHAGDTLRLVRALEVFHLTRQPISAHFTATVPPLDGFGVATIGLRLPAPILLSRITRRVDAQFARGFVDEVKGLLASGVPPDARAFRIIGYRQVIALVEGRCSESEARADIVKVTRQFARRQLAWFRHEPDVAWINGAGEAPETLDAAARVLKAREVV